MNVQQVTDLAMGVIYITAELSLPLLVAALVSGLVVSVFQAATQINEATLSFLPKIAVMIVVFIVIAPWMMQKMSSYTTLLFESIPGITRNR